MSRIADHDRGVARRHVPRLGRVDVVALWRLVVPGRGAEQRVVRDRRDRQHRDRRGARYLAQRAEPRQRHFEVHSDAPADDVEGGEVGLPRPRRRRRLAPELRLEPHLAERLRQPVDRGDAETIQTPRLEGRGGSGRSGDPGAQAQLETIAQVARLCDRFRFGIHHRKVERTRRHRRRERARDEEKEDPARVPQDVAGASVRSGQESQGSGV